MSIRLIASDMDGTLLNSQSRISQANLDAIRELSRCGAEFMICSGRDYPDAKSLMEEYHISCGFICLSGAVVYDSDGTMLTDIPLSAGNLNDIKKVLDPYDVPLDFLTSKGRYCTADPNKKFIDVCRFLSGFRELNGSFPDSILQAAKKRMSSLQFIKDGSELPEDISIYKICCQDLDPQLVLEIKEQFSNYPDLAAASSFPTNIELTNQKAQKGIAIKNYAALKGIDLNDIMVLGDSDNDASMFIPEISWTVAMANSMPCILEAAKYRTRSNTEDGVAYAIRKYVFEENI